MSILKPFRRAAIACAAMLAMTGIVRANNIFSVNGASINYSGGEIDNQSPDPISPTAWFFGTPIISGLNDLDFTSDISQTAKPINFRVVTPGAQRLEDGTLTVNASTAASGSIALMSIIEGGDYLIQNGTAASTAAAVLNITSVKITSINGVAVNTISLLPAEIAESFSHPTGSGPALIDTNSILFSGNGPLVTGTWQGAAVFNLAAALTRTGHAGQRVTGLQFTLDDILSGTAEAGSLVEITKKDFLISTNSPVPEPSSIILGVLGGLGMVTVGYRKKLAKSAA